MRARGGGDLDRVKRQRVTSRRGARRSTAGRVLKVASAADLAGSDWGAGEGSARAGRNAAGRSRVIDGHSHSNSLRTRAMAPRTCKSRRHSGRRPCPPWCRGRSRNQTTDGKTRSLCGSTRSVLTHSASAILSSLLSRRQHGFRFGRLGLGATLRKIQNSQWNPRFPRQSRQSDQIVSPRAEKFDDAGFMRPQPPRATHTTKQETCKFSSRLVSRPASISPDPPRARFGPRRARRRATPSARSRGKNEDKSEPSDSLTRPGDGPS